MSSSGESCLTYQLLMDSDPADHLSLWTLLDPFRILPRLQAYLRQTVIRVSTFPFLRPVLRYFTDYRLQLGLRLYGTLRSPGGAGVRVQRCDPWTMAKYFGGEAEAENMRFVKQFTSVPVPHVFDAYRIRTAALVFMEHIEGERLDQVWSTLDDSDRDSIATQLRNAFDSLRKLECDCIGSIGTTLELSAADIMSLGVSSLELFRYKCRFLKQPFPGPCLDVAIYPGVGIIRGRSGADTYGPFPDENAFNAFIISRIRDFSTEEQLTELRRGLRDDHPFVFTHGDLSPKNIIVRDGQVVAILDWGTAGFWPDYWERLRAGFPERRKELGGDWGKIVDMLFPDGEEDCEAYRAVTYAGGAMKPYVEPGSESGVLI